MTPSESQRVGIVILAVICLSAYGLSLCTVGRPRTEKAIPFGLQSPETIAVEFRGGPDEGIYFFPRGMSFQTLYDKRTDAFLSLKDDASANLRQGARLSVLREGGVQRGTMSASSRLALDLPLDVNQAAIDDLALVPGIGESTAAAIVLLRRQRGGFSSLEELRAVPGIKEKRFSKIRSCLSVGSDR
jgi:competence protein ComEA